MKELKGGNMAQNKQPVVGIVMGSDSDLPIMKEAGSVLKKAGVCFELRVLSAHRAPEETAAYAKEAAGRGIQVLIAGAGGAAHLAGVLAAHTILPVIGVPLNATSLQGTDSLLATLQMPPGIPVATVSIGEWGARNAGILAIQIMGLSNASLADYLKQMKVQMRQTVLEKDQAVQKQKSG